MLRLRGPSQTVIPAKGEAREPGTMVELGTGQRNSKRGGGNALVPWLSIALADEWTPDVASPEAPPG